MIRAAVIYALLVVSASAAVDSERLVDALREREGYRGRPGALGEAGPYQIRAQTWAQHMPGVPFARAREEGPARACALKHVAWLRAQLAARGVEPSVFNLAAAWNAGLARYVSGRAPERAYRFAADVEAIYSEAVRRHRDNGTQHARRDRRLDQPRRLLVLGAEQEWNVQRRAAGAWLGDRPAAARFVVERDDHDRLSAPRREVGLRAHHVAPPVDGEDRLALERHEVRTQRIDHAAKVGAI
ncbi:MAG: hypothetical protein C0518_05405 [Opitutus sp.]|nr:hypothetical protein [Opitutus sp.]